MNLVLNNFKLLKKGVSFSFLFLICNSAFTQSNNLDSLLVFNKLIRTDIEIEDYNASFSHNFYLDKDTLYIKKNNDNIIYCLKDFKISKLKFKKNKKNITSNTSKFAINNNYLVLMSYQGLKVYKRNLKKFKFLFDYKFELYDNFENLYLNSNYIYLSRCYNYSSGNSKKYPCRVTIFDINEKKMINNFDFDFKFLHFTHFGNSQFIDFVDDKVVISNTNKYEFVILDSFFRYKNVIKEYIKIKFGL